MTKSKDISAGVLNTVLADGYDREAFERMRTQTGALGELTTRLGHLLPHPEALVGDVFFTLFKLNAVIHPKAHVAPSALINRALVLGVLESGHIESLRRHTALDEGRSATATVLITRRVLDALKQAFRHDPKTLLDAAESEHDETLLAQRQAELRHLEEHTPFDNDTQAELQDELRREVNRLRARLRRNRKQQEEAIEQADDTAEALGRSVQNAEEQLERLPKLARGLGIGQQGGGAVDVDRRLELGERIMRDPKLARLARLVGAMRELAFEARRRRATRAPQQTHSIHTGNDLERVLPSELAGLRARGSARRSKLRRLDFLRRYNERQLLQYHLDSPSQRGPMVICLDGSGSMHGSKELWGKALALTLMEIARRERRACLAIIFSSGHELFEVELTQGRRSKGAASQRAEVRDEEVLRFAAHFPGGGTEFEPPLRRALRAVTEGDYRRGDIVFITDGQAHLGEPLLDELPALRKRHQFRIRAILVDVGEHERSSVARFADEIYDVTDLAGAALESLYAGV